MRKSSSLAKGGLYTALSILFIYLSNIIITNRLFLLGAASLIIPIAIITIGIKFSILVYTSVSIISLMLLGPRVIVLSYIVFWGLYGFIKLYIEKLRKLPIELILKLIFFNLCVILVYYLYTSFFIQNFNLKYSKYLVLLAMQVIFLIYDYILTVLISYFNNRFKNKGMHH